MESGNTRKKIDFIPLLFLVLSAVGVTFCYDFLFIPVMFVLPALWVTAAMRSKAPAAVFLGLICFTSLYGLAIGYDILFTLRIVLLAAPSAFLLYAAHTYKLGNTQAALYLSVTVTFGFFAMFCFNSLRQGKPAFYEVGALFQSMVSSVASSLNVDSSVLTTLNEYVANIDIYFPAVLYSYGALCAFSNVVLLQLFNRRKHLMPLVPVRPFGQWRLPRAYVLCLVFVMVGALVLSYTGSGNSRADMIMLLANYMLNMPLSLVGVNMLYSFFTRKKKSAGRVVLFVGIIIVLLLIGVGMYTLAIIGFIGCTGRRRPDRQI